MSYVKNGTTRLEVGDLHLPGKKLKLHISYELGDPNEPELCPTNGQGSNWEMDTMLDSILKPFGYEGIGRGSGFGQRDLEFQFNPDEIRVPFERIDLSD